MAFITLSGTLLDPNGDLAVGDQIRFTHKSTTGETVESAVSIITINPAGTYSLPLQYGLVLVEYKDVRKQQFENLGVATVNQDNPATSIPELLNALVPVSSAELIEFQAILADCVAAQLAAENAATTAEAFAYQLTTTDLIASTAIFAPETNIPTSGYDNSGDGGNGSWKQNGITGQTPSQSPAQLGDALLNDGNGNQWELVADKLATIMSVGASELSSEADNTLSIQALINSGYKEIYRNDGVFNVTSLTYDSSVSLVGPGKIIPSSEFQTDQYGGIARAGTKIGNTEPLDKHGGFLVGGEGPTPEGVLLKSQYNASMDIISSRESNPLEVQLYPNASTGVVTGNGTGRVVFSKGFSGDLSNVYADDIFWVEGIEYKVATKVDSNTIDLLNLPGLGAATIPVGDFSSSYIYITVDCTVDISGVNITRVDGEAFQSWGGDHNVVIDGVRYDATVNSADSITLSSAPPAATGKSAIFKWLSDENFIEIFRLQRLLGQGTEETLSLSARPDMYKLRMGRTADGIGRYSPLNIEGPAIENHPFPNNPDATYWATLGVNGFIGFHQPDPLAPLHLTRRHTGTQGADDTTIQIDIVEGLFDTDGSVRSIVTRQRNDFSAPYLQATSGASYTPTDLPLQKDGGNVDIGQAGDGIKLTSPNGTKYTLTVSDAGALIIT
jgi:hypothetical protein